MARKPEHYTFEEVQRLYEIKQHPNVRSILASWDSDRTKLKAEIDLMRKALKEIEKLAKFLIAHGVNPSQVSRIHSLSYHAQDPQNRSQPPAEAFPE